MTGIDNCMEIVLNGEQLLLSPLRAVFWPSQKSLILADLHLGKSAYFRNNGVAIPSTVMIDDLKRLSSLIYAHAAERLIVAGDMFHHNYNADISIFKEWRITHCEIEIILVPGNHDKLLDIDYRNLDIAVTDPQYTIAPFIFEHEAIGAVPHNHFRISGHLHPGYVMAGKARQSLRLPCFIQTNQQLILPAFSAFTGLCTRHNLEQPYNFFIIGEQEVFRL